MSTRLRTPFSPDSVEREKLIAILRRLNPRDPTLADSWSQAGAVARHDVAGHWWAAVPPEHWPQDAESAALIREKWDERVGDARQELVPIGMNMDEATLRAQFDACLLTDKEMAQGPETWATWHNPFPNWP